jgi:predicted NBD/HSP70 family sugar kinase
MTGKLVSEAWNRSTDPNLRPAPVGSIGRTPGRENAEGEARARRGVGSPRIASLTPQSVRYVNELRALNVLFRDGGMSRAALARQLGLNRSTTGNIIANLIAEGLVMERVAARHLDAAYRTGRPGIMLELDPSGMTFLGAEIGLDRLQLVAMDLSGRIIARRRNAWPAVTCTPDETCAHLAALVRDILPSIGSRRRIGGFGVAIPALIDGEVVREATLMKWRDVPLVSLLHQHLSAELGDHVPIVVENDANALALAETYSGTSRRSDTVAFFMIDGGAGGGIVIGGELFRGSNGVAGEFGHLKMGGDGYAGISSHRGSLESYIGKAAVLARYYAHGGTLGADLPHLLAALAAGEEAARLTAQDWGEWLARGLLHVVNVLNPGLVIVGGSVGALLPHVSDIVEATLAKELRVGFPPPKVELSKLAEEGAAFGSAFLMHQRMFSVDQSVLAAAGAESLAAV